MAFLLASPAVAQVAQFAADEEDSDETSGPTLTPQELRRQRLLKPMGNGSPAIGIGILPGIEGSTGFNIEGSFLNTRFFQAGLFVSSISFEDELISPYALDYTAIGLSVAVSPINISFYRVYLGLDIAYNTGTLTRIGTSFTDDFSGISFYPKIGGEIGVSPKLSIGAEVRILPVNGLETVDQGISVLGETPGFIYLRYFFGK